MKILVGTDFSPNASEALAVAIHLARRFNDSVQLIHAATPTFTEGMPDPLWEEVLQNLRERMKEEVSQHRGKPKVSGRVEIGSAPQVLTELGRPGQARLAVVSSIGKIALRRFLLGSTAERIAESLPVPTLVTRSTVPFREWAEGQRPLRVFVAIDFTLSSDAALAFAAELAAHGPCTLTAGYVEASRSETNPTGIYGESLQRDLSDKVVAALGNHPVQLLLETSSERPAETLIEMAKEADADLFVTGTHQHHGLSRLWHRSTSRAVLNDAPMNVACVPLNGVPGTTSAVPTLNRVLVPTDFSPAGNRAVAAACALLPNGGRLRLFHALTAKQSPIGFLFGGSQAALSPGEHLRLLQHARRRLGSMVPAAALKLGVNVEVVVEPADDVTAAILQQADQFGAHVICLSSHGRTAVPRAAFGSVAGSVVARSHRAVHLVRTRSD